MCQSVVKPRHSTRRQGASVMEITIIGLDLAKNVFQVHGVDAEGTVV